MPHATPDSPAPPPQRLRSLRERLLRWYREHRRDLPWRATGSDRPDPYHVLVSEAMLQQTQVATVIPYFDRFLDRFPTVRELAEADEQEVLAQWQGLGYYRRARHLHAAAKAIVAQHGGRVPDTLEALLNLPGIGRYTAGAIASIAFDEPAPLLDGNVARVLSRWFVIDEPVNETPGQRKLWSLAEQLVPRQNAGDFNQALMELGALVCTPRQPQCLLCPAAKLCEANRAGRVGELPVKRRAKQPKQVTHAVAVIEKNGRFLFQQRPGTGLWSRMWELPTFEGGPTQPTPESLVDPVHAALGLHVEPLAELPAFTHQTSHRTIRFLPRRFTVTGGRLKPNAGLWRRLDQLEDLPLAKPQRKLVAMLESDGEL